MSGTVIKRRLVDEALHEMLENQLTFPVGLIDMPDNASELETFAILTPIPSGESYGPPLTAPDADASLEYDITSVGQDGRQAAWVADEVRRVMLGRNAHGALLVDLVIEEHESDDRWASGGIGAPRLESSTYQAVDSYYVKVSRT